MGNYLVTAVWKYAPYKGNALLVMLALADQASDDEGITWLSVGSIAKKCRLDVRNVQRHLQQFEADGAIKTQFRAGRSSIFTVAYPEPDGSYTPGASATPLPQPQRGGASATPPPAPAPPPPGASATPPPAPAPPRSLNEPLEIPERIRGASSISIKSQHAEMKPWPPAERDDKDWPPKPSRVLPEKESDEWPPAFNADYGGYDYALLSRWRKTRFGRAFLCQLGMKTDFLLLRELRFAYEEWYRLRPGALPPIGAPATGRRL